MAPHLRYPVMIPYRPDGKGMLAQGGQLVDGREVGHIVPLLTYGFSPKSFLAGVGITTDCGMSAFEQDEFLKFLTRIIANPSAFGVAGFVVNPEESDLKAQPIHSATDLLMSARRSAG